PNRLPLESMRPGEHGDGSTPTPLRARPPYEFAASRPRRGRDAARPPGRGSGTSRHKLTGVATLTLTRYEGAPRRDGASLLQGEVRRRGGRLPSPSRGADVPRRAPRARSRCRAVRVHRLTPAVARPA